MAMNSLLTGGMMTRRACGQNDPPHDLPLGHAQSLGRLPLADVDGLDAGPKRFRSYRPP